MEVREGRIARSAEILHRNFVWLSIAAYAIAAVAPECGQWMRRVKLGNAGSLSPRIDVSLPALMLALLLLNAGLGIRPERLRGLVQNPGVLLAGLLANLVVPLLFILGVSQTFSIWHNPAEVQCILVGLALIASMPVAGSSTAWSQNANGDLALGLGLVLLSTCLSPLTTPAVLQAVGWVASGAYADSLRELAAGGTSSFLVAFVLLPSLAGIALRVVAGERLLLRVKPLLKLANSANLLLLCYSNAAVALPDVASNPDWDFLVVMFVIVLGMCSLGFVAGWAIAHLIRADEAQRTALTFGLGMTNNGTGLVLGATGLAQLPGAMLPVLFYNLIQHVVAAIVARSMRRQLTDAAAIVVVVPKDLVIPANEGRELPPLRSRKKVGEMAATVLPKR